MQRLRTQMWSRTRATRTAGLIAGLLMLLMLAVPTGAANAGLDSDLTGGEPATFSIDREDYFAHLGIDWQSPYAVRAMLELTDADLRYPVVRPD